MRIGLIHNWPGSKNSELDLIGRIIYVLKKWGHQAAVLDPFGKLLDPETGHHTEGNSPVDQNLDFVLYLHYLNPKLIDSYSYVVNWNPLRYLIFEPSTGDPLPRTHVDFVRNSMISHDYMLSASSALVDEFQSSQFGESRWAPRMGELKFHTSCQIFEDIPPAELDDFKVFYIGANWEKVVKAKNPHIKVRHEGLLESLDATGDFVFYGIRRQHGVDLWEGFQHYKGELPFDAGESIVETCSSYGAALVLSSDAHRDSGVVSTRIFQACAARCVIIADNNSFIVDEFGDSVLVFDYVEDTDVTVSNIREKVEWIKRNPEEAKQKAEKAHRIFKEKFSLDAELGGILHHHENNIKRVESRFDKIADSLVDVYFNCPDESIGDVARFLDQLAGIKYIPVRGILMVSNGRVEAAEEIWRECLENDPGFKCKIVGIDNFEHKPDGENFYDVFSSQSGADFFALWNPKVHWYHDHLANLVLESLNSGSLVVQSATYVSNEWFDVPAADAYFAMHSVNAVKRLEFMELMTFDKTRIEFASLVFSTKLLYQDWSNMLLLKYLDSWFPFMFLWSNFASKRLLPAYVPKFTCRHTMDKGRLDFSKGYPDQWDFFLTYDDRTKFFSPEHQVTFMQGAYSNNNNHFLALSIARSIYSVKLDGSGSAGFVDSGTSGFSLNRYMQAVFAHRPMLLKTWNGLFRLMAKMLKLD